MQPDRREVHPVAAHDSARAHAATAFVLAAAAARRPQAKRTRRGAPSELWRALVRARSALWLDTADIDACLGVWTPEFSGLTTNNTLLNREVQKGAYDEVVPQAAEMVRRADAAIGDEELVREVAFVLNALHAQSLVRELGVDACVELHTDLAHDAEGSYQSGRTLHAICPEHFVVKVPLTPAGLVAARRLEADGVRVNCTLGFSPRQNRLIADFAQPHFVNVFLGRVDSLLDAGDVHVPGSGGTAAALASQRMLDRWRDAADAAHPVRQIAASLRSAAQLPALAGIDVLTIPVDMAREFPASDVSPDAIVGRTSATPEPADLDALRAVGLDVFWEVGALTPVAGRQFGLRAPETMDAGRIRGLLDDNGLGALFPDLSPADQARIENDGKIPDWPFWRDRVAAGTASWDGLLTAAGLGSFAAAQAALDARIRRLL